MSEPAKMLDGEAPPCPELLADAVEALEAGRLPAEHALEELVHLVEQRPAVARELRRRRGLRALRRAALENPGASGRTVAVIAARRFGDAHPDTLRKWARWGREAVEPPQEAAEAQGHKEASP